MDRVMGTVRQLLDACAGDRPHFPRTALFNETWLLRLALDWHGRAGVAGGPLGFSKGAGWFSEALLPSPFLARRRGDRLAESWTHADGVVGHFTIGNAGRGDLCLAAGATQFTVIEAKLFSRLSSAVKNATYYDQAARNVACMAEVLSRAKLPSARGIKLSFVLVAPAGQIAQNLFGEAMTAESIRRKVRRRADDFAGERDQWHADWFEPLMANIELSVVSWEEVLGTIEAADPRFGEQLRGFYAKCLEYNGPKRPKAPAGE